MSSKQYTLARDVTFPAGTKVFVFSAGSSTSYGTDHASALLDNGPNSTVDMRVDLEEALDTGLIIES